MPALDGLRILDLTQYEAGTSCTQALAWMGADVVKVESTDHGDPGRAVGFAAHSEYSAYFCNWNANKRSVSINLKVQEGKNLFLKLIKGFDVFIENYGPGVVERLGLDYATLREIHPGLIYARIKGFGNSGPYSGFKSFDSVAQAAAGAFSVTGAADGPPTAPGTTTGDSGSGVQMAMAILAAYIQRTRTGEGQEIELSMQEAVTYFMRSRIGFGSEWGTKTAARSGNAQGLPPVNAYPCKPFGANDWLFMMPVTAGHWDELCVVIDNPELLVDPRFETIPSRIENRDALYDILAAWTSERTKSEAMEMLGNAGIPCSACLDTAELHTDPHLVERGFVKNVEHPLHGDVRLLGFPPRLSGSEVPLTSAPLLGEHTDEVLESDLGLDAGEIATLKEAGVVRQHQA
jgi:formyl-CoA transferase